MIHKQLLFPPNPELAKQPDPQPDPHPQPQSLPCLATDSHPQPQLELKSPIFESSINNDYYSIKIFKGPKCVSV